MEQWTMHISSEPNILYFGTPVVLVSSTNEDGSYNLAPMSSAFWLGWRCMLGWGVRSQTAQNMLRTAQCVLNLPSVNQVSQVNRLAKTTGSNPVPEGKAKRGYRFEPDKFGVSGLTPVPSETVDAPRVLECPVQMEAVVEGTHWIYEDDDQQKASVVCFEVRIQRVYLDESIVMEGNPNRVDPDKWRPLIMSFQKFYGLGGGEIHTSTLAEIPEAMYRSPDVNRAQTVVGVEA
jgi:flavin reductase (DIM6/NTAB) family NADH-FMN oxidoreductase RutF